MPSRSFSLSLCALTRATAEASDVRDSLRAEAYTTLVATLWLAVRVHFLGSCVGLRYQGGICNRQRKISSRMSQMASYKTLQSYHGQQN